MSAADQKVQELLASFRGVNWNNPGGWPVVVKATVWLAIAVMVLAAGYGVFITKLNTVMDSEHRKELALVKDYEEKAFKAQNLDAYKKQLADMEEAFGALLRQLPKDTEVPSLLEDINHTGVGSGLEFRTIDLGQEAKKEFYAELPITIEVTGDYHGFGAFVSGVAALPRIVTLHDFSISADDKGKATKTRKGDQSLSAPRVLVMKVTARTYRYNDASTETEEDSAKDKKKGKKKAKDKKDKNKDK